MLRGGIKEIEEFPRRLKIFFWIIIFLFIFGTLGFKWVSGETIKSSFYRTIQTLAFMFNENSTISERFMEIFLFGGFYGVLRTCFLRVILENI